MDKRGQVVEKYDFVEAYRHVESLQGAASRIKPSFRVKFVRTLSKAFFVPVHYPRIHAQNSLLCIYMSYWYYVPITNEWYSAHPFSEMAVTECEPLFRHHAGEPKGDTGMHPFRLLDLQPSQTGLRKA